MNERIRELAEQADAYAKSEYEKWTPTPDFSGVPHIRNIFNKKFAELIVRECAKVADSITPPIVSDLILEHFGVEE